MLSDHASGGHASGLALERNDRSIVRAVSAKYDAMDHSRAGLQSDREAGADA